jgi:PKD repeat protein
VNMYQSGYYTIKAYSALSGDAVKSDDSLSASMLVVGNSLPANKKITLCGSGRARLTLNNLSASDKIAWYKSLNDTIALSTRDTFVTGTIKKDSIFYVGYTGRQSFSIGLKDTMNNITGTGSMSEPINLWIYKDCSIDSVTVYPQHSGFLRIVITDHTSAKETNYYYPVKVTIKTPYQPVRIGINKQLLFNPYHAYFLRVDSIYCGNLKYCKSSFPEASNYPIVLPGIFTIKGTGALDYNSSCSLTFWPYLFNWSISASCPAEKFPFPVHVGGLPTFSLDKEPGFAGAYNSGTLGDPDVICVNSTVTYRIFVSYPDSDYNNTWKIKALSIQTTGGAGTKDTQLVKPTAKNIGRFIFTPSAVKSNDSIYKFTMTIGSTTSTGCDTTVTRYIRVIPTPATKFYTTNGCVGKTISFSDSSTSLPNPVYSWDFGDSSGSTQKYPTHSYSVKGNYKVTLTVANTNSCNSTYSKSIFINNFPKMKMIYDSANCMKYAINFRDSSKNLSGATRLWDFGDGATDTSLNTYHFYKSAGIFHVKLRIINANGCADSVIKNITVYPMPKAMISSDSAICLVDAVDFKDVSISPAGMKRYWNFGDGGLDTATEVKHSYKKPGSFTAELLLVSQYGCRDSVYKNIVVNAMPKAAISYDSAACLLKGITLKDISTNPKGSRIWDFGDGIKDTAKTQTHFYKTPGTFPVGLIITNTAGCRDSLTRNLKVYPLPKANFKSDSAVCLYNAMQFNDLSGNTGGKRTWNFGDGKTDTVANPVYMYKSPGNYNVKLVISNSSGCKDSITRKVVIAPIPKVVIAYDTAACFGNTVKFSDNSVHNAGDARKWDFGDGMQDTSLKPNHIYANPGKYDVKLVIMNSAGCKDSVSRQVVIHTLPKPGFNAANACQHDSIHFINSSTDVSSSSVYAWSFDDSSSSSAIVPVHYFKFSGMHKAVLQVTNGSGCQDTFSQKFMVYPMPVSGFTWFQPKGLTIDFIASDTLYNSYKWQFGDSTSDSSGFRTVHTYGYPGTRLVSLQVGNTFGCNTDYSKNITILKSGIETSNGDDQLNIYPNPFSSEINVEYDLKNNSEIRWELYDISGKRVAQSEKNIALPGKHFERINTDNLVDGMYNLRWIIDGQIISRKLICIKRH